MKELIILCLIPYAAGSLSWFLAKWANYGIYEKNLLRCALHSLLAPVWPIALLVYAAKWLRRYAQTRLKKDYAELFPPSEAAPIIKHSHVDVALLGEGEPRPYKPGDWVN